MSAFTKLRYDPCTYNVDLRQSLSPGQYVLDVPGQHCTSCLATDSRVNVGTNGGAVCSTVPLIDVESDLHNITRRATGCPAGLYAPSKACASVVAPDCRSAARMLPTVDTRLNNPPCTLRCTGWNRWEWLCQDPQDRALAPFDSMVNTAIVAKDNHRPHVACPIDQNLALPAWNRVKPALSTAQPGWAQQALSCQAQGARRAGDGIGADGAPPILSFRGCKEVGRLVDYSPR
jgi:hypothetical protein